MGQSSSGFVLGVVVAVLCSAGSIGASAERADAIPLVVIVHDRAEVLPETLDQALKEAARIYWQLGVALKWHSDAARVARKPSRTVIIRTAETAPTALSSS